MGKLSKRCTPKEAHWPKTDAEAKKRNTQCAPIRQANEKERYVLKCPNTPWRAHTHEEQEICQCVQRAPKRVLSKLPSKAHSVTHKNWYNLRYDLSYIKSYLKSCKNLLGKPVFFREFLHDLRYNFVV